jgi:cytochrome c biogenesis protein CcdA
MKNLQKAGGISSLISAATTLFAMGLVLSVLTPLTDPDLGFGEYLSFLGAHKTLVFIWNFTMYHINGISLTVFVLALYERLKTGAPYISKIAALFGFMWIVLIFASGLIIIYGNEAVITLAVKNQNQAEILKQTFDSISLSIDHSDKLLGCLWIGLASIAAFKNGALPKIVNIFGIIISIAGLSGICIPALIVTMSYVFGLGLMVWLISAGISMLCKQEI